MKTIYTVQLSGSHDRLHKNKWRNIDGQISGPTYSGIIALQLNAKTLSALGFHLARCAHEHLSLQYSFRGINDTSRKFIDSFTPDQDLRCRKKSTDEERAAMYAGLIARQD